MGLFLVVGEVLCVGEHVDELVLVGDHTQCLGPADLEGVGVAEFAQCGGHLGEQPDGFLERAQSLEVCTDTRRCHERACGQLHVQRK